MIFGRIHWQSPQLFWVMAIVLAAAFASVLWLYRPQVKPLAWPWSWALLLLRIMAIGALALSILRPTLLVPLKNEDRDIVAVLVDQSKSMSIQDQGRSPAELVQIADAMDLLPPNSRPGELEALRTKVNEFRHLAAEFTLASGEEDYARLAGRGMEAAAAHRRDTEAAFKSAVKSAAELAPPALAEQIAGMTPESAAGIPGILTRIETLQAAADEQLYRDNAAVRKICDEFARLNRIGLVNRALEGDSGLIARLSTNRQVRLFGFGESLVPIESEPGAADAGNSHTDLARALGELRQQLSAQRIGAVLVLSDGRQVINEAAASSPSALRNDVPVTVVSVAAPIVKDLSVSRVTLPASAFVGESITVRVDVSAVGFEGEIAEVVVEGAGQRQVRTATIAGEFARAEMNFNVTRAGPQELSISVTSRAGEVTTANNSVRRVVKGVADRIHAALIGGIATRDFQQLRIAIAKTPGFVLMDQLVDGAHPCDLSPQAISEQDVVVLSDVPPAALSQRQWDALSRLMNEDGGSVLLVAGDPAVLASYGSNPFAASLLPWRSSDLPAWRVWPGEEPQFRIVPADAEVLESLRLSSDPELSRQRWNQLPPVFRFTAMPPLKPGARALLVDRDSGAAVMTESRMSAGRSLLLGMSEIWRWRSSLSERDEDRIWTQILRYAAREPYAAGDGTLWLDADKLRIEPGEPLRVRARVNRSRFNPDDESEQVAPVLRLSRNGSAMRNHEFPAVPGAAGRYETTLSDLTPGDYEIQFAAAGRTVALDVEVADSDEAEMRDVAGDPLAMARIAGARGEVLPLGEIGSLPQRLAKLGPDEPVFAELTLWDSPYLFLFVLGCFGLEWAVRKRMGLA